MPDLIRIRASSLWEYLDCAARAYAKHILGKRTPAGSGLIIGSALHKSTAVYDQSTIDGAGLTPDDTAGAAVDVIQKPEQDVDWGDDNPTQAEDIVVALHHRYCSEIAPVQDYAAVEVTCEQLDITDIGISLTGTTDRMRRTDGGVGISDIKSGKSAVRADGSVDTKGHAWQIGAYELLAEHGSGVPVTKPGEVVGLQVAKTERGQRVAKSQPIDGARRILIGDDQTPGVLHSIGRMLQSGHFPGNPHSMLCSPRYCPEYDHCFFRR